MKIKDLLGDKMETAGPVQVHGLGVLPLVETDDRIMASRMLLLDEALREGFVHVTEVGEDGLVPFLFLKNGGSLPILILEGEELVGGKQNRIVNTTILVPAGLNLSIPVSCMEQGRWKPRSAEFDSGGAIFRARSRARQKASVNETVRRQGSFSGDQHIVWGEVRCSLAQTDAVSPTADFRAARERASHRIEEYVDSLKPIEGQVGAVFYSASGVIGCELLATPDLFAGALEKIVRSFAFEVLDQPIMAKDHSALPSAWLEKVLGATAVPGQSPGAGEDIRISTRDVIGSGLIWQNQLLHLSCFPQSEELSGNGASGRAGRQSASARRRRMQTS